MLILLKNIRISLGSKIPQWMAKPFYMFACLGISLITWLALPRGSLWWIRHSLVLGYWQPLASDIDISLWTDLNANSRQLQNWIILYRLLKRIFPWIGEVNIYWQGGKFAKWINYYELQKDPTLKKFLNTQESAPEKLVFILKTLETNALELFGKDNLKNMRPAKWDFFVKSVGTSQQHDIGDFHLKYISDCLGKFNNYDMTELKKYFEYLAQGNLSWEFPARTTIRTLFFQRFCFQASDDYFLDDSSIELIKAILKWEVWGVASQLPFALGNPTERETMKNHIQNLAVRIAKNSKLAAAAVIQDELFYLSSVLQ
jgi:hypothetical protein